MIIGSHVNFGAEQLLGCAKMAKSFNATTFMFYTGAPQNTLRKEVNEDLVLQAHEFMKENNIELKNVVAHAPYIVNLANKEKVTNWHFGINFLKEEIKRVTKLGVSYMVLHPGNALKLNRSEAIHNIAEALNLVIDEDTKVMILLETMAGKGSECGVTTTELKEILDNIKLKEKVGICIDTCHLNDAGYDMKKFDAYIEEFDHIIGINKIKCVHINDSKNALASHKDRHANIGFGTIGFDTLINIIYHDKLKDVPKILETPWINENPPYKFEIAMIYNKTFNPNLFSDVESYYK